MLWASVGASTASNRQSSTFVACSEKSAKFTPLPSHVAPSGEEWPGQTRMGFPFFVRVFLARKKQEPAASHNRPHTSPDRDVDRLLLLSRQLERAQLDVVGLLSIAERVGFQKWR